MENFSMMIANLIGGILILIIGLVIQTGKANFLIAGYNTMSKEEQEKWDSKAMSKFTGWILLVVPAIILLVACIPIYFNFIPNISLIVSWIAFTSIIIAGAIYMNVSSRFKKK